MSRIYAGGIRARGIAYGAGLIKQRRLPTKVVSIGNITVGGTGKTPMTMFVADLIQQLGYRVAVISRGYKGSAEKTGGIVSDGQSTSMTADQAGDEPYLMATKLKGIPVLVGQSRLKAGLLAVQKFESDVVVLDDAFQHLSLKRDINLLLIDYARPFGNRHLIPRGPLREPLIGLSRADAIILTRAGAAQSFPEKARLMTHDIPLFKSVHEAYLYTTEIDAADGGDSTACQLSSVDAGYLFKKNVFAFSGIASHDDFMKTIEIFHGNVVGQLKFPDHHPYHEKDMLEIQRLSADTNANLLVTTEKDFVRFAHRFPPFPLGLVVLGIKTAFGADTKHFTDFIASRLESP